MNVQEESKKQLLKMRTQRTEREVQIQAFEDKETVITGISRGYDAASKLIEVEMLGGSIVKLAQSYFSEIPVNGESLIITFAPGSSRAKAIPRSVDQAL